MSCIFGGMTLTPDRRRAGLVLIPALLIGFANGLGDIIRDCALTCNVGYRFVPLPMLVATLCAFPIIAMQNRAVGRWRSAHWPVAVTLCSASLIVTFRFLTLWLFSREAAAAMDEKSHWASIIRFSYIVYYIGLDLLFILVTANLFVRATGLFSDPNAFQGPRLMALGLLAGGLAGSWIAGRSASLLLEWFGGRFEIIRDHLLFGVAAALLLEIPFIRSAHGAGMQPAVAVVRERPGGMLKETRRDPLLRRLALLYFAAGAAPVLMDFLFYWLVATQGEGSGTGFVEFFANFYIYLYAFSLLMLGFGAERFVRRFGLGAALVILPVALLAGVAAFFFLRTLLVLYVLQILRDGLADSLYSDATDRLIAERLPARYAPVRGFLEGWMTRAGVGAGAVSLLIATWGVGLSPIAAVGVLAATLGLWLCAARSLAEPPRAQKTL